MARALRRNCKFTALIGVLAIALAACSSIARNPVPDSPKLNDVPGVSGPVRFWGDEPPKNTLALVREAYRQRLAAGLDPNAPVNFLAVSGGGSEGAFGAGLLVGWSDSGTRPSFELVTGISTGALIAPFAFMGSDYDQQLKAVYTSYGTNEIAQERNPLAIISEASAADNAPLANLIAKYIDADFMAGVAREARKGRALFIGTTFLDAQRPVIWDMGAIALRGDGASLALFRKVMLASASIPGVFPPALISVEQDGKVYDEMHVDGGVANQVFIFPGQVNLADLDKRIGRTAPRRVYLIRNARLRPSWDTVSPGLDKIAEASISSLIKYQGIGDINRIYLQARNAGAEFNLAYIPDSFVGKEKAPFDLEYMRALYDFGYAQGRAGYKWNKKPPDL
jgi:Patatin-like phospholipase